VVQTGLWTVFLTLVSGPLQDELAVLDAMKGVYGAFTNTDRLGRNEEHEVFLGIRFFELAARSGIRHYVYLSLDYGLGVSSPPSPRGRWFNDEI
jgi:hypothetical protein